MEIASRTLVKSPPELWELIDQPDRMQGLMCALVGRATEVTVHKRSPESVLRWEASDDGADAWIEIQLAEKGWGTNVKVKAEYGTEPNPPPELAAIEPSVEEAPAVETPAAEATPPPPPKKKRRRFFGF